MRTAGSVKVKTCGVTNVSDALVCEGFGADFIGMIFADFSKRYITKEQAKEITSALSGSAKTVGVFVNATSNEVNGIAEYVGLDYVQIHNNVSDQYIAELRLPAIRVVRVKDEESIEESVHLKGYSYLLFDTYVEEYGGGGKTFDWTLLNGVDKDFFLAGGLTPENVGEAVRFARPFAVDVSSGIEKSAGIKDAEKVRLFIENAHEVKL